MNNHKHIYLAAALAFLSLGAAGQGKTYLENGNPSRNSPEERGSLNGNNTGRPQVSSPSQPGNTPFTNDAPILNGNNGISPDGPFLNPNTVTTPNGSMDINTNGSAPPAPTVPGPPGATRVPQPANIPHLPGGNAQQPGSIPTPGTPMDRNNGIGQGQQPNISPPPGTP